MFNVQDVVNSWELDGFECVILESPHSEDFVVVAVSEKQGNYFEVVSEDGSRVSFPVGEGQLEQFGVDLIRATG